MCRPLFRCFFWVVLLGPPAPCPAQPSLLEEIDPEDTDIKELAKAAFEASQATPRDLARARVEAVRTQLRVHYQKYLAGDPDVTFDRLLELIALLTEAELAVLEKPTPADRQAVLAARWLFVLSAEQLAELRYHIGRVSLAVLMQARHARLDAEIKLREAEGGKKLSAPFVPSLPLDLEEPFSNFDIKEAAKSAFEAGRADLRDLARARRDAARITFQWHYEMFRAGAPNVSLDRLLEAAAQLAETELAALEKSTPADQLAVLAARWWFALFAEQVHEARYKAGRTYLVDLMRAKQTRLEAEIKLQEADAEQKLADLVLMPPLLSDMEKSAYAVFARETTKRVSEAGRADLRSLARARRDAARTGFLESYGRYRYGAQYPTFDLLLEDARRLLEAELAVRDDPAERLAAHERYWGTMRIAENIVGAKYASGRVSLADYAQAQYERLDAEIRMREAREKQKEK